MAEAGARAVATDPRWLPHTYDPTGETLTSVFVPRGEHSGLMFLSDEHFAGRFQKVAHNASEIAEHVGEAPTAPIHFIFHTAFCCSTLLVKALTVEGHAFGLKEPDVLINLANRFIRSDDAADRDRLQLALRLLARPFADGESIIVKPTNFANRLAEPTLELLPDARAVFIYSDMSTLMRAILKRGMWGRIWGRKLFLSASAWSKLDFGYTPDETFVLTDLQALGLAWLMQIHHFSEMQRRFGDRILLVDSADFLANPAQLLTRAGDLFSLGMSEEEIARIAGGPVFSRHSKFADKDYGTGQRDSDQSASDDAHREEISMVVKWVEAVAAHLGVDPRAAEGARRSAA